MSIFRLENALFPMIFARILIAKPVPTFAEYAPAACALVLYEISRIRMPSPPANVYGWRQGAGHRHHAKAGLCFRGMDNSAWSPALLIGIQLQARTKSPRPQFCCCAQQQVHAS